MVSYQIEGATNIASHGASIWDTFSKIPSNVLNGHNGVECESSYVTKDVELLKDMCRYIVFRLRGHVFFLME